MKELEAINQFIIAQNYSHNSDILGLVFYGSSKYHTNTPDSDIDLLVVTDKNNNYKGLTYIDGYKIEYFEKNFYDLLEKIECLPTNYDRSLLSIFKNGEIIFSKNQAIQYLQDMALESGTHPSKLKTLAKPHNTARFYEQLENCSTNSALFAYNYYNLLEDIRKQYHEQHGYSKIPTNKVYELYQDKEYARDYYCVKLPDDTFRECYLSLLEKYQPDKLNWLWSSVTQPVESITFTRKKSKEELKYYSTIVKNSVDKSLSYEKRQHPSSESSYYITVEKIRKLYCDIHQIDDSKPLEEQPYDQTFLNYFNMCLTTKNRQEVLPIFFDYVTEPLHMNYKNYKVHEFVK